MIWLHPVVEGVGIVGFFLNFIFDLFLNFIFIFYTSHFIIFIRS